MGIDLKQDRQADILVFNHGGFHPDHLHASLPLDHLNSAPGSCGNIWSLLCSDSPRSETPRCGSCFFGVFNDLIIDRIFVASGGLLGFCDRAKEGTADGQVDDGFHELTGL